MDTEDADMQRFHGEADANPPELIITYTLPSGGPMFFGGGVTIG